MLRNQPQWLLFVEALALVVLIGWVDYSTPWEWSFFILYALPIGLVTWNTNRTLGFAFSIICTSVWCVALIENNPYLTTEGIGLAVATRLFYFLIIVIAVNAVKSQRALSLSRLEQLKRSQALERDILLARDREEQRICGELHDCLGSHLAAITYAATFLMNGLRERNQPEAEQAAQLFDMVSDAVSAVQNLSRGIFPAEVGESGLALSLEELAIIASKRTGINISFYNKGDPIHENPLNEMHLHRITQEAVNNAAKHGNARNVTIVLNTNPHSLHLVIADDGKGMAVPLNGNRGLGLRSMRYRARMLGGDLVIESNPNEGTIVSCEIPMPQSLSENTAA